MKRSFFSIIACAFLLYSCDKSKVYEKYISIPDANWSENSPVKFEVDIQDTIHPCNILVSIRNSESYPFRNLFLEFKSEYPNELSSTDTLEFYLISPNGKPLGNCTGDLCDIQYEVAKNQIFKQVGLHTFTIKQIMRTADGNLPLIVDVGLRIEKAAN